MDWSLTLIPAQLDCCLKIMHIHKTLPIHQCVVASWRHVIIPFHGLMGPTPVRRAESQKIITAKVIKIRSVVCMAAQRLSQLSPVNSSSLKSSFRGSAWRDAHVGSRDCLSIQLTANSLASETLFTFSLVSWWHIATSSKNKSKCSDFILLQWWHHQMLSLDQAVVLPAHTPTQQKAFLEMF